MQRGDRVGVLMASETGGTCLAPAIVLSTTPGRVEVMVRKGDRLSTHSTITEYVEPPILEETWLAWQPHWQEIEDYLKEYGQ